MASNSNPTSSSVQPAHQEPDVIYENYLHKRGRIIKVFWKRYFKLLRDGSLQHFRDLPGLDQRPYKIIDVKNGEFLPTKVPRPYSLHIRKRQDTEIEYVFAADTEDLRKDWLDRLKDNFGGHTDTAMDTVVAEVPKLCTDKTTGLHGCYKKGKLDNFTFVSVLGSGSNAKVILVKHRNSEKLYAMKLINRKLKPEDYGPIHPKTESHVLFLSHHQFLSSMSHSFNTDQFHCFVMDFGIGGDLRYHLIQQRKKSKTGFSIDRTRFYAAEIACGLGYLHSNHIIYRDLKLENVLLDKDGHIKVADFGLCKENIPHGARTDTLCGTPGYVAPEVLCASRGYGQAADWWSFGVVVYEMLFCRFPRADKTIPKTKEDLLKYTDPDFSGRLIDEVTKEFIKCLLREDPSERLGGSSRDVEEVKEHDFFKGTIDWSKLEDRDMKPPFEPETDEENVMKYFDISHLLRNPKGPSIDPERLGKPIKLYKKKSLNDIWAQFSFHEDLTKTVIPADSVEDTKNLDKPSSASLFDCLNFR